MNLPAQLLAFGRRCHDDLIGRVIPFWFDHGVDRQCGGFFTGLDRDGSVYDDRKYVWLQGRAVWMFARLYNELEPRPAWLDAAAQGLRFLRAHALDGQGRLYFSLTRQGEPYFYQRKPYAAVFYLLALVEYYRATGQADCLDEARALFDRIVTWIADPRLLDRPALPGPAPTTALADVMVLASMAIELMAVDPTPRYLQVLRDAAQGARRHFDPERRILMEYALTGPHAGFGEWPEARFFNPGHSIEVAWFLLHLVEHLEDAACRDLALAALEGSLESGWDPDYGGLFYFMDVSGRPTLQLESSMKLWWPHTEALYALVRAYEATRDPRWLRWLERVDQYCAAHFVDPEHGGWFGYCDRQGTLTHSCKGGSYKGFFHVPRALLFCSQRIAAMGAAGECAPGRCR